MAKQKNQAPETPAVEPNMEALRGLDGFEVISTDKVWVRPYTDLVVRGVYIGHEVREGEDGKPRTDAQVRLTHACGWETDEGPHAANPGDVVTITITATLRKIPELPIGSEIVVKWGEKVDIGKGQSVWRSTVWAKAPAVGHRSALASGQPKAIGPGSVAQRIADLERVLAEAQGDPPF